MIALSAKHVIGKVAPAAVAGWLLVGGAVQAAGLDVERELRPFVNEVVKEHGLDPARVEAVLSEARILDRVIKAMSRPAERKPWKDYRKIFLTRERIDAGEKFYREHEAILRRAEEEYGVSRWTITAIIGVETFFGRIKGRHRVLDSLATLGFRHKRRGAFFKRELSSFLALSEKEGIDPLTQVGSYAGAMGIPQFIPTSYHAYAIDFDGDGRRDLIGNPEDAIGSVANYLARHGWRRGEPVAIRSSVPAGDFKPLVNKGLKMQQTAGKLSAAGLTIPAGTKSQAKAALHSFRGDKGQELWVTLRNFYAITRYNHSKLYALAVHQLAEEIAAQAG